MAASGSDFGVLEGHDFDKPDRRSAEGTNPVVPFTLGYINPNHDEGNTTNGEVDVPF